MISLVICMHAHLDHKNCSSEIREKYDVKFLSSFMNVSEDTIYEKIFPMFWACDAETHVKAMEEAGIDKSLVMVVDFGMNNDVGEARWSIEEQNQWVAQQVSQYPDKLFALCAVDPRRGEKAIKLVEKAVNEWGMKGVKFHPTAGYYPDNPDFYPLYKKCVELDVPVCSHTAALIGPPFMSKYADPIYLDTIAAKFPDLKILMIHFGSLTWNFKCAELMFSRPNLYADLSGYQAQALIFPESFLKFLRSVLNTPLRDKIMFGTDWPYLENFLNQKTWVEWLRNIPEKAKEYDLKFRKREIENILDKNARNFLNI